MSVSSIATGIATIALAGPAPSVYRHTKGIAHVGVTCQAPSTLRPSAAMTEVTAARSNTSYLRACIEGTMAEAPVGGGKDKGSKSSGSSGSRRSAKSSSSSSAVSYRYTVAALITASFAQGALTASAFTATARLLELLVGVGVPPTVEAILAALGRAGSRSGSSQHLSDGALSAALVAGAKALAQLLASVYGIVMIDTMLVARLTRSAERDMRRRLMLKYFKEQYYGRTAMLQALGFAQTDSFDSLQSSVNAWAGDMSTSASLLAKLAGQLAITAALGVHHVGVLPMAGFLATMGGAMGLPVLMASWAESAPSPLPSSSREKQGRRPSTSSKQHSVVSTGSATPSRRGSNAGASSSSSQGITGCAGRAATSSRTATPPPRSDTASSHSHSQPSNKKGDGSLSLRLRLFEAACRVLACLCATSGAMIAGAAALSAVGYTPYARASLKEALTSLLATAREGSVPAGAPMGRAARQWGLASMLLANACMSLANLVRTVYGPLRSSGRHAADIVRREGLLKELKARVVKEVGQEKEKGGSSNSTAVGKRYALRGDAIVVQGLDVRARPSAAPTSPSPSSSSSSAAGRGRSDSGKGRERESDRPLVANLCFTAAPGSDVLIVCQSAITRSSIMQIIGHLYAPTPNAQSDGACVTVPSADALLYLGRHSFLSRLTLKQQILYPRLTGPSVAGESALMELLERVGLGDLFDREEDVVPQGWDTPSEQLQRRLSQAERQRVCLARALYHKPRFLLIDDAMSALSAAEERAFYEACHSQCITCVTAAPLDQRVLAQYVPLHKNLVQIGDDGQYIFGAFMATPAAPLAATSPSPSLRGSRRFSGRTGAEEEISLPPLRVVSATEGNLVGTVLPFNAQCGAYAYGDDANPFH